jgi:hypothetical protein
MFEVAISFLAVYFLYAHIIHPLFLSPLRKVPAAHWSSSISSVWIRYHRRKGSQALPAIADAHSQKGPIIRLSPNEVSVSSLEGAKKVYVERGGFAKPLWWAREFASYGVINMTSMEGGHGSKEHATRKRELGNVYAKSFVMVNENLRVIAKSVLARLVDVLRDVVKEKNGVMDVYKFNGAISADFTSAYVFGQAGSTRFLVEKDLSTTDTYYFNHDGWIRGKADRNATRTWLEEFGLQRCSSAESALSKAEKGNDAVVFNQVVSRGLQGKDLASEMLDHFIAGAEGPRTTLTYLEWELSKQPDLQAKLREELLSVSGGGSIPDFMALDSLPFLDAILTETLRVYAPTPGNQYRITPPEGTTIHGVFIPGGTEISAPFGVLQTNPTIFPEPHVWRPERWLIDNQSKVEEMRKWIWAFGKGSRICVGKDFILIGRSCSSDGMSCLDVNAA